MLGHQPSRPWPRHHDTEVTKAHITTPVSLQGEREHGIRPCMHAIVYAAGQVHAEERVAWVRNRVHEPSHLTRGAGGELVVLATERDDAEIVVLAGHASDIVAHQPWAGDNGVEPDRTAR